MNSNKIILIFLAFIILIGAGIFLTIQNQNKNLNESPVTQPTYSDVREDLGTLIEEKKFEDARTYLDEKSDVISPLNRETQETRIETTEAYVDFYTNPDARSQMIDKVKKSIDDYFLIINSEESSDSEKASALMSISFLYTETWSDKSLLLHIADKLGLPNPGDSVSSQVGVFTELFTRALDYYPVQEAYLRRAWFNSRLVLNAELSDTEREALVTSIKKDLDDSGARNNLTFYSPSKYYNGFIALAYADVVDFLAQEKIIENYLEVEVAYKQALEVVAGDFFGSILVQDIIRMNYAASLYRYSGEFPNNPMVTEIITPVANHIREYSGKQSLAYEGILVMLRAVPVEHNQNNESVYKIFQNFSTFSDIPPLLNWKQDEIGKPTFKII